MEDYENTISPRITNILIKSLEEEIEDFHQFSCNGKQEINSNDINMNILPTKPKPNALNTIKYKVGYKQSSLSKRLLHAIFVI